jgi:hypothetical protein
VASRQRGSDLIDPHQKDSSDWEQFVLDEGYE